MVIVCMDSRTMAAIYGCPVVGVHTPMLLSFLCITSVCHTVDVHLDVHYVT